MYVLDTNIISELRQGKPKPSPVRNAIRHVLGTDMPANQGLNIQHANTFIEPPGDLEKETERILELVKHQNGY